MTPAIRAITLRILLAEFISIAMIGCSSSESRKAKAIARGRTLFELHCNGCHNGKRVDLAKVPPDLRGVFRHDHLPSGALATDEQVRSTIMEGRSGIMPPFKESLDKQEVDDLIRYLHTLNGQ